MEALHKQTIAELRKGLAAKSFSSVELTKALLARADATKDLNAYTEVFHDLALEEAKAADAKIAKGENGALLGVPIAIKDMILVKDKKTTAASKILANFVAPYNATVVNKLRDAGAVMLGKTNMDEFAMGSSNENSAFGPVKNPWDPTRVPGGSSGGSAAAVAAFTCPASLGTDTGGSIRQPASLCNLVGLKPTYGRVSRYGVIAYASSLDQVGPFARSAEDCALMTQVLAGVDPKDSTSVNETVPDMSSLAQEQSLKGLRIGVPKEYMVSGTSDEVSAALKAALGRFSELGAQIVDISLPHTDAALSVYYILAPAEASSNLARYDGVRYGHRSKDASDLVSLYSKSRSEGFGAEVRRRIMIGTYVLSSGYYDAFYMRAQKVRTLISEDFNKAFASQCDVIVSPTSPTTAFKIGEKTSDPLQMYLSDIFTIPVNLAGVPGLSMPGGFDKQGLPIGLQVIGKRWDELTLFKVAKAYQATTDWHRRSPAGI